MASDEKPKDLFDFDLPEGLDDDLGGDWESAFQAEDFMLSPDAEGDASPGQETGDDVNLAALLQESDESKSGKTLAGVAGEIQEEPGTTPLQAAARPLSFLAAVPLLPAQFLSWYKSRPPYQKILFPAAALVFLIIFSSILFFRTTSDQLARQQHPARETVPAGQSPAQPAEAQKNIPTPVPLVPQTEADSTSQTGLPAKTRKKWSMPGFFITVQHDQSHETVIINVDLTLILLLDPGQPLPEQKKAYVRDTIYQFYSNRPVDELRRYSLARGEMIRNLESWLKKAWPDGPVASIIFDKYRVVR
ncbi:MAG: hypothetical protein BM485_12075 [Desulfobulbaceae bacterium DB1]|nr:MAG: hypothetical protein BM485_12075 [Desulfobulbaceae bacterium DB1]